MKLKPKFDKAAIKAFFVNHGEKLAFVAAAVCFVGFAWSAVKRETLPPDKSPEKLTEASNRARDHVANSQWDPKRENLAVTDYPKRAERAEVPAKDFELKQPFDPLLWDPKVKRTSPEFFAAEDLRAAAGVGSFAITDAAAAPIAAGDDKKAGPAKKKGARGKGGTDAPGGGAIEDQLEKIMGRRGGGGEAGANKKVEFAGTIPPPNSKLKLTHWTVVTALLPNKKQNAAYDKIFERAIGADKDKDVPHYYSAQVQRAVDTGQSEDQLKWQKVIVPKSFINSWAVETAELVDPDYVWRVTPLGPLVNAWWDESVGHHPQIPFVKDPVGFHQDDEEAEAAPAQAEDEDEDFVEEKKGAMRPQAPLAGKKKSQPMRIANSKKRFVDYLLFRFFDFNVEPGKRYRYRVKMQLDNPNYNVAVKYLKSPDLAKEKYVETPWSAVTPAVTVPFDDNVLLGSQIAYKGGEPATKLWATKIDPALGFMVAGDFIDVTRGTPITGDKNVEVADPKERAWKKLDIPFHTRTVALDLRGGRNLPGKEKLVEPGEVLLFARDGGLLIRDETDDLEAVRGNPAIPGAIEAPKKVRQIKLPGANPDTKPTKSRKSRGNSNRTRTKGTPKAKAPKAMKASKGGSFE